MGFGALEGNIEAHAGEATFRDTLYGLAYGYEEAACLQLKANYGVQSEGGDNVPAFRIYTSLPPQYHGRISDELGVWVEVPLGMTWDEDRFCEIRERAGASEDEPFDESGSRLAAAEEHLAEMEELQAEEGGWEESLAEARKAVEAAGEWDALGQEIYSEMYWAEGEARQAAVAALTEAMGEVPDLDGRSYGEFDVADDMKELVDEV